MAKWLKKAAVSSLAAILSLGSISKTVIITKAEDEGDYINGEPVVSEEVIDLEPVEYSDEAEQVDDLEPVPYGVKDTKTVTAIIELETPCVIDAGLEPGSDAALNYAGALIAEQSHLQTQIIEQPRMAEALNNKEITAENILTIRRHYTNVLNGFSAEVPRWAIKEIAGMPGVKNVFESRTYEVPEITEGYETEMFTSGDMIGVNQTYSSDYQGEGIVVGILDTGLDTTHSAFAQAPSNPKITSSTSFSGLNARSTYKTAKVPFAYDYADSDTNVLGSDSHGTHVAGTIAADNSVITGIAPQAQLAIFKVFSDTQKGAADEWIISALEDVVIVKPDVINMSLGSPAGDAGDSETGSFNGSTLTMAAIYQRVYDAGVLLSISAGNESYIGASNGYPYADNPNVGIVGSPSTYPASLSVASIENTRMIADYFTVNGETYSYSDSSESASTMFTSLSGRLPLEYVDCGLGSEEEFAGVDVNGKIALIKRGSLSFVEKQANAKNAGAAGAIIYNNVSGTINMSIDSSSIPCVSITLKDGEKLLASPEKVIASIGSGQSFENAEAYQMSDFSSWGTTDELSIKPEITAPGGHIYSSIIGGGYADYSGTSMAAPHSSGAMALIRQYAKDAGLASSASGLNRIVNQLIMSTASPVPYPGSDGYYSVRNAGAGLVNVNDAMAAHAYLSVNGTEDSRPKIELGYDVTRNGSYTMNFNITNISDSPMTYSVDAIVQTDYVEDGIDTLSPYPLEYTISGDTYITVAAGETRAVSVNVELASDSLEYMHANYPNGGFVEGYIVLTPTGSSEDSTELSLPFVGFSGDWDSLPLFDASELNGSQAAVGVNGPFDYESYAELDTDNGYYDAKLLGMNAYDPEFEYFSDINPAYMTVSNVQNSSLSRYKNSVGDEVVVFDRNKNTGLLYFSAVVTKNADWIRFRVYNTGTGAVYFDDGGTEDTIFKNYEPDYYALWNPMFIGWTGTDASGNALADGTECTLEVQISRDGGTTVQSMTLPVTIDNSKPYIVGTSQPSNTSTSTQSYAQGILATTASGKKYLKFRATDNQYLAAAQVGTAVSSSSEYPWSTSSSSTLRRINYTYQYLANPADTNVFYGDQRGAEYEVILDVTSLSGSSYYVALYDYTRWKTFYRVSVGTRTDEALSIDPAETTLMPGVEAEIEYTVTDESGYTVDPLDLLYTVESAESDRTYIDETGILYIAADETAPELTVTAALADDPAVSVQAKVILTQPAAEYTVTAAAGEGGSVSPEGTFTAQENEEIQFTVTADEGYVLEEVTVNGEPVEIAEDGSFTITVTGDTEVRADFAKLPDPLEISVITSDDSCILGEQITLTAEVSGGVGPYEYKFTRKGTSGWSTLRGYSNESSYTWTADVSGNVRFTVSVKDSQGNEIKQMVAVDVIKPLTADLKTPAEGLVYGTAAVLTGIASGGVGPYEYKLTRKNANGWTTVQNYSSSSELTWTPDIAGKVSMCIYVRDSQGTVVKKTVTVQVAEAFGISVTAPSAVKVNEEFAISAEGFGGEEPYTYKFTLKEGTSWTTLQKYSAESSLTGISFSAPGSYRFAAYVRDASGETTKKLITVKVTE